MDTFERATLTSTSDRLAESVQGLAWARARPQVALNRLQPDQVIRHVAGLVDGGGGSHGAEATLTAAAEACARLVGARRQLGLALDAQKRHERLRQLAQGRGGTECDELQRVAHELQQRVSEALNAWWRDGIRFTRVTRLLPTQLDQTAWHPSPLGAEALQALMARFVRTEGASAARFELALSAYAAAQRRCQSQLAPARAALAHARRVAAGRGRDPGGATHTALAYLQALSSRQALVMAETEPAVAHHVLHVLASGSVPGATSFPSSNGSP